MISTNQVLQILMDAEDKTLKYANRRAFYYSSGKYKAARLRKMGHPYSERRSGETLKNKPGRLAVPYGDPARINIQTGDFYLSWRREGPKVKGDEISSVLYNADKNKSRRLEEGISGKTIPRPLIQRITPQVEYWRNHNIRVAFRNAIQSSCDQNW